MNICIYGSSSARTPRKYIEAGERLGAEIARRNHRMVFGGGGNGMMGAVSRGVCSEKGRLIGIVPQFFNVDGILCESCDEMIYTDTMSQRKMLMAEKADAFIVTPGGLGTMDEFFEIITLRQLNIHNKAIVLFNVDGCFDLLLQFMEKLYSENIIKNECRKLVQIAKDEKEALDIIDNYVPDEIKVSYK